MQLDESSRLYPERGPGRSLPVTTSLERALIVILVIVVTISIGLTLFLVSIKKANDKYRKELKIQDSVCSTPSCVLEASNLLQSMDTSVDPCTDFYSFVCGNWIKNNYLVSSLETQFTKLSRVIILRVKGILEDLEKQKNLPEHKQKTSDFYKSCMDDVHRKIMGAEELISDLKKFGGWPLIEVDDWEAEKFDWTNLIVELFKSGYINNMLFSVKVDIDAKNTSRSLISVSKPSLGLMSREYYVLPYKELISSYKDVIFKLAEYLNPHIHKEKSMGDIENAFNIENKLAQLSNEIDMKYPENYYNIETLRELEISTPKIPWRKILKNLLPPDTELTNEERIMITSPSMIKGLNSLLGELDTPDGKRALANYMFYRVVFNAANYLDRKFYILILNLFATYSVVPALPWEICTKITMELFAMPLTASYVEKYMENSTKEELKMMFDDMRNSLMDDIRSANWLDDKTKNYALLKARKIKAAIAYEDEIMDDTNLNFYYKDVNITENHFGNVKQIIAFRLRRSMEGLHETRIRFKWTDVENLLTANAYYLPNENSLIIPVGVLQATIFAVGRPNYINYGSLGMIVGHELTHAFDSIGCLYDAEGSYRKWWSKSSWKIFEERMKCFEKQYNSYYVSAADSKVNGTLTLGENIADNGGLKTAYYAYLSLLKRIHFEKSLPGLPYNEKQMFWISFASVWCRKQTEESINYTMKHSVHTPSQFRVIGSLSNMKEFSEDFNCTLNSTMNPTSRCFLWK
nr:venom protein [Lampona murina]